MAIESPLGPITEGIKISEKFMLGDLIKVCVNEMKQLPMGWGVLPEKQQQQVIERMTERVTEAVRQTVHLVASNGRPHLIADLDSVTFKDGIKATLAISRHQADRHELADAQGGAVMLVLPQVDKHLGGEMPKPDKDQPDLLAGGVTGAAA